MDALHKQAGATFIYSLSYWSAKGKASISWTPEETIKLNPNKNQHIVSNQGYPFICVIIARDNTSLSLFYLQQRQNWKS